MSDSENIALRFERLAREHGNAPALVVRDQRTFSFADLASHIHSIGCRIEQWGGAPGDVIAGVIADRLALALASVCLPAMAVFAPLSPHLSVDAYVRLLRRIRPKFVALACDPAHPIRQAVSILNLLVIEVAADANGLSAVLQPNVLNDVSSELQAVRQDKQWAYLLSSSGSTGDSKLIPITHAVMEGNATDLEQHLELGPTDLGCHITPLHYPHGLRIALMLPLLCGSPVLLLGENDAEDFFQALGRYGITWVTGGFTLIRHLAERAVDFSDAVARSRLRFVRCGSGTLPAESVRVIEERLRAPMIAAYNTVETGPISIDPLPPKRRKAGGVGLPLHGNVRVVDDSGSPCANGSIGEIEVRGPRVFEGYYGDPIASAEAFRNGWYRTGDLGRFDAEGYLFIEGRAKEVINRGGEKIFPAEVEHVVEQMAGVIEAAAFALPHRTLGEELAIAVVRERQAEPCVKAVEERLHAALGRRGLPRRVFFIDKLPRTETGKVKRGELAQRLGRSEPHSPSNDIPSSPFITALASMWSVLLGAQHLGATDNFFMLGGDSLTGARLLAQVQEVFGVALPSDALYHEGATVLGMAKLVESSSRSGARSA